MPVSVFKESRASNEAVMSEIPGVQLNRLLVLATPSQPRDNAAMAVLQEMVEAEFARLTGVRSLCCARKCCFECCLALQTNRISREQLLLVQWSPP